MTLVGNSFRLMETGICYGVYCAASRPLPIQTDPNHRYVLREISKDQRTVRIRVRSDNLVGDKKALTTAELERER